MKVIRVPKVPHKQYKFNLPEEPVMLILDESYKEYCNSYGSPLLYLNGQELRDTNVEVKLEAFIVVAVRIQELGDECYIVLNETSINF